MHAHLPIFAENEQHCPELEIEQESFDYTYDCLKAIDPVAANRLHPNDHRKVIRNHNAFYLLMLNTTTFEEKMCLDIIHLAIQNSYGNLTNENLIIMLPRGSLVVI